MRDGGHMRGERSIGCDGAVIYPSTVCAVPPISEDAQWRCLTAQHEDVLDGGDPALIRETMFKCIVNTMSHSFTNMSHISCLKIDLYIDGNPSICQR